MHIFRTAACAAVFAVSGSFAFANVTGVFDGPPSTFSINLSLTNTGPASILSIMLDGSTGDDFPILWDIPSPGEIGAPGGTAALSGTTGAGTQMATLTFASFGVGDTFSLTGMDPDGDPGPTGVEAGELSGVGFKATLSDGTMFVGSFVDDPAGQTGPILRGSIVDGQIPLPAALPMLAAALGGLTLVRRKARTT